MAGSISQSDGILGKFAVGLTHSHPVVQFGKMSWADVRLAKMGRQATKSDVLIFFLVMEVGGRGCMWSKGGVRRA
jgi:hypothetical protein